MAKTPSISHKENVEEDAMMSIHPLELVERILRHVSFVDRFRFSGVLAWRYAGEEEVRVPWLMIIEEKEGTSPISVFNPLTKQYCSLETIPMLEKMNILCSKHGWLLIEDQDQEKDQPPRLFFLNPITGKTFQLPYLNGGFTQDQLVTFSHPPTSGHCMLFTIDHYNQESNRVRISYCCPGETAWTSKCYPLEQPLDCRRVLFSNGTFVLFDEIGLVLACFNVDLKKMCFDVTNNEVWYPKSQHVLRTCKPTFYGEYNGMIFQLMTILGLTYILKLSFDPTLSNREFKWSGDSTFFVSMKRSMVEKTKCVQNEVWFVDGDGCYRYDINTSKQVGEGCFLPQYCSKRAVWIEPVLD